MNKKQNSLIAVYAIVLVIYNLFFFAIPFEKIEASWISYAFTLIAIIASFCITAYAFGKGDSLKSKIYGLPIFKVGIVYAVAQFVFGLFLCLLGAFVEVQMWIAIVVSVLLLCLALLALIAVDNTRDIIEEQEVAVEKQTRTMTYFKLNIEHIVDLCKDAELKKSVAKLSENFKYSDPVSCDELAGIERKIAIEVKELKELVVLDEESAKDKVSQIENLLADRNRRCKALKK